MKRGTYLTILFIFLLIINIIRIQGITGDTITGEASAILGINISVVATTPPTLTIISPENETYLTNESLLLNYSVSNEETVWYNLDNNAPNTTITSLTYFNTSQGSHILYLYANNSQGTTTRNITFFINSTRFVILYDKYYSTSATSGGGGGGGGGSETAGTSTDFASYSYEDIQNLNNIILENTQSGKILFNQAVNLIDDLDPTDNIIDINSYINISFNRIELNSTALPNFNKTATLSLYNLTFTNPRIAKEGVVCQSTICTKQSYSGGTLVFNVTHFTTYSAEETPVEETTIPSGGGGRGTRTKKDFSIDKEKIKITLKQGETKKQQITIKNIGNAKIKLSLQSPKLQNFLKTNETSFELETSKSKTITLDLIAKEDTTPDLYTGKLIIKTDEIEKEIFIIIEVESKSPLFDVKTEIPNKFLYVLPGEGLSANINVYNIKETGKVDVALEYIIKNEQGETITSEQETRAVETELNFIKTFKIPEDVKHGTYTLYIKVIYNEEIASASSWFEVRKKSFFNTQNILYIIIIFIIIVLLVILIELKMLRKYIKVHGKIKEGALIKKRLIKRNK